MEFLEGLRYSRFMKMRPYFYFPKTSHPSTKRLNTTPFVLRKHCTNQAKKEPATKVNELSKSNKWGYAKQEDGFKKHDKNTTGLYHLGTINLPQQLEKNLNEYLRKFPSKHLIEDAIQLSKHLQNRGRPTERTWTKYKEAKAARQQLKGEDFMVFWTEHDELFNRFPEEFKNSKSFPSENTEATDNEIDRIMASEGIDSSGESSSERRAAEKLTKLSLTKKPKQQEYKLIRYQKREAAAYAADRAPASYGATLRVLHEIAKREQDFKPETVLDFGSGIGTATWAVHEVWKDSIKFYQCVDVSRDMNETAEYLLRNSEGYRTPHYVPRVYFKDYLPVTDKVTYDIVLASYSLSETPFRRTRQALLESLWRKTNNFLVIVEKGNNEGFDITMQARNLVTDGQNENPLPRSTGEPRIGTDDDESLSGFVFSPCPHDLACPRFNVDERDHPCNFEQRVQLSFAQQKTNLKKYGYYNEIFSYVVLRKAKRSTDELDWARLLRPVRLREKHVICNVCNKNGNLEQKILTRRKHSDIYKCVRHRAKWGDLLPIDVERKDHGE